MLNDVGSGLTNGVYTIGASSGIVIFSGSVEQLPIYNYIFRYCLKKQSTQMKALLGMAKQRRKQQSKEFKPLSKLNLQKKLPQPSQPSDQEEYMQQEFEQQYEPEPEEILGYAEYIGIKLPEEQDLLYIAREGLLANLPPEWEQQETEDGNILYLNMRTNQIIAEHPCDEYYRQLVIKQRKKKGKPVGIQPVGQQAKAVPIQIQQPKKDIDPLVKMQMQKKKKKLQQQKKKQFDEKKKIISDKYAKKKQALQNELKAKEKKLKQKYDQTLESERQKITKKMSEQERAQEEKSKRQLERFERQIRAKLEKKYYDKRTTAKQKIQRSMKAKRDEIRSGLQNQLKAQKKELEDELKEKLKVLADKQRQSQAQKSDSELLNQELTKLKQEIIQRRLKQHAERIEKQQEIQQSLFKSKLQQLAKAHQQAIKSIQTSAPKNQIKFDSLTQEVEQLEKQELQALQYELVMMREVKKAEKQYELEKYRKAILEQNKELLNRMEREAEATILKVKKLKEEEYCNKIAEAEKKMKETYLQSLKQLQQKFNQEQEIIQLESQGSKTNQTLEKQSLEMMSQVEQNLGRKEQAIRGEIQVIKEEIRKLGRNSRPAKHKLTDEQVRMYELIKQKLQTK